MFSVIIIEPENPGNIGAVARVMANFGFSNLLLINPHCDIKDNQATSRAMHGRHILRKAKVGSIDLLDNFDYLAATTAKLGTDYNIPRSPLEPSQLAERLAGIKGKNIGLVIGRESNGLTNDEIQRCDFICTIPSHKKYPTLNISHALAIVLYEIYMAKGSDKIGSQIIPAGKKEKDAFFSELFSLLDNMEFSTEEKRETQKIVWKKLIGKSFLTKRELYALFGFIKKIREK